MDYDIQYNDFNNFQEPEPPKSNKKFIIIIIISFFILCICASIAYYMFSQSKSTPQSNTTAASTQLSPSSSFNTSAKQESSSAASSSTKTGTQISAQLSQQNKPLPNIPGVSNKPDPSRFKVDINCQIDVTNLTYTCSDPENGDYDKQTKLEDFPAYTTKNKKLTIENGKVLKVSYSEEVNSSGNKNLDYYILIPYAFIVDLVIDLSLGERPIKSLQDLYNTFDQIDRDFDKLTSKIPELSNKCLKLSPKIRSESKPPYNTSCIFFPGISKFGALADTLEKVFLPYIPEKVQNEYFNIIDAKIRKDATATVIEYVMFLAMLNRLKKKNLNYIVQCASSDSLNTKVTISC